MLKKIVNSIALLTLFLAATTQALPIVQADAFTPGDNKAALETDTGLVWMDFGINSYQTYTDVLSKLSTDYVGWRLPSAAEVDHMWTGLFGDFPEWSRWDQSIGSLSGMNFDTYFNSIFDIFGHGPDSNTTVMDEFGNVIETWTSKSLFGVFMKETGVSGIVFLNLPYDDIHYRDAMYLEMTGVDISEWGGTLLVKDTTVDAPEPTSLMLLIMGILGFVARRARVRH